MSVASVIDALALPQGARVDQRVPKKLLIEQGAPTASDKRQIQDGIETLQWIAALKPTTIGIPIYRDDVREYLEIAVLVAGLRGSVTNNARASRLMELIHRAIPYPVLLVAEQAGAENSGVVISLAHKRHAQNEAGKVVIEGLHKAALFGENDKEPASRQFLSTLAISTLPTRDLFAVYQSWIDRVLALEAAAITGAYAPADSPERSQLVSESLDAHAALVREIAILRTEAQKEKQMNRRVELNLEIKEREVKLAACKATLHWEDRA